MSSVWGIRFSIFLLRSGSRGSGKEEGRYCIIYDLGNLEVSGSGFGEGIQGRLYGTRV